MCFNSNTSVTGHKQGAVAFPHSEYDVETPSDGMVLIQTFVKTGKLVHKLKRGKHKHTQT